MKLTVVAKKINNGWRGALVIDGHFQDALISEKLEDVVLSGLVGLFTDHPEKTSVTIDVLIEAPKQQPGN